MTYTRNIFMVFTLLLCILCISRAQISGVKYGIHKNASTGFYDCFLYITNGQAISPVHRTQFNAQISIVVPTGSNVAITEKSMPLQDNQQYTGKTPCDWRIASVIKSPQAKPENDFYSFIPTMTPSSQYNNMVEGDSVKLFSISIQPLPDMGHAVRLYQNNTDPDSSAPGMLGANFSNGFTIGGLQQVYEGNIVHHQPKNKARRKE